MIAKEVTGMDETLDISHGKKEQDRPKELGAVEQLPDAGRAFLANLLNLDLLTQSIAEGFLQNHPVQVRECDSAATLGKALVSAGLLTDYQFDRIMAGTTHGLVLGQYRVLRRLGAGGMGVVFVGEHKLMKRKVAIKVLPVDDDCRPDVVKRFYLEMRVLAQLHHPNIVTAYDSGRVEGAPGFPHLLYLAMELVDGCDLEDYVHTHGPVPVRTACDMICQAAAGLQEAHNCNLVHRDIKPSNLLLTLEGKVKLVDFGLVRQFSNNLTDPKSTLGTLDYMPPEQCTDPTSVGSLADIYALGATLFWLLTGQPPYPRARSITAAMKQLQEDSPQKLRSLRCDAPPELEAFLLRLLDRDPSRRPPTAMNVVRGLQRFAVD